MILSRSKIISQGSNKLSEQIVSLKQGIQSICGVIPCPVRYSFIITWSKVGRGITDEQINQLRSNVKYYQFLEKYIKSNNDQVLSACCKRILILLQYNEYSIELLHTLFVSYFRVKLGITTNENNKPNVLYKQYIASFQSDATKAVLKKNTNIIDKFNNSRNNESLAHDVKKLNVTEEYIIFDEIFNIIICIDNPHTN